jgi:hypothetical protein
VSLTVSGMVAPGMNFVLGKESSRAGENSALVEAGKQSG